MIYNPTSPSLSEEDDVPNKSGSSLGFSGSLTSLLSASVFIRDLNLHPGFCKYGLSIVRSATRIKCN